MDVENLASMKYAEIQKLAKKAGIKANVKHEKLVAALTKYYEEVSWSGDKDAQVQKDKNPSTPKTISPKGASKHVVKSSTPNRRSPSKLVKKPSTPSSSSRTPVGKLLSANRNTSPQVKSPSTPGSASKRPVGKLTPVHRIRSPLVRASPKNALTPNNRTVSDSEKKLSKGTPVARTPVRTETPSSSVASAKKTPSKETQVARNTPVRNGTPSSVVVSRKKTPSSRKASINTPSSSNQVNKTASGSGKRKAQVSDTPTGSPPAKKRRSTFEIVPTPEKVIKGTPNIEEGSKKRKSSPGVQDMLGAMKPEMSNEEMKQSLLSAIDKKVQAKCLTESASKPASSIPRFAAFLAKKKEQTSVTPGVAKKPITPGNKDWAKIHKKNFDKFDSIDVYLDKKKQRADEITASVKKAKNILAEVQASVNKLKSHKTPTRENLQVKKPRTSNPNRTTPFKPTALNLSQTNFNFGAMKSPKTIPRKSPKSVMGSTAKKMSTVPQTQGLQRKSTGTSVTNKPLVTPYKFTATLNTTVHASQSIKKSAFDLQASLAKPLTWRPHKGKLKPFGEKSPAKKPAIGQSVSKSRDTRRADAAQRRADKKHDRQMARRGINV